jgi:hypothetical protein
MKLIQAVQKEVLTNVRVDFVPLDEEALQFQAEISPDQFEQEDYELQVAHLLS